jgi:hypothetical protein
MSPDLPPDCSAAPAELPDYPAGSAELPGCSAGCQEPAVPAALLAGCFAASRDSPTGYRAATVAPGGECSSGRTGSPPTLYCFHGRILRSLFHAPHRQACFVAHARVSKDEATSVPNRLLPHGQTQRPDPKPICRLPLKDRLNSHSPRPRNLSAHRVILAVSKTPIPRARSTARAALRSAAATSASFFTPFQVGDMVSSHSSCNEKPVPTERPAKLMPHTSLHPLVETGQNCRWSHSQVNRKPRVCAWPSPTQQPTPIMS